MEKLQKTALLAGLFFATALNPRAQQQLTGQWHTYPITQSKMSGYSLPPRTFKADFEFSPDGSFAYAVIQSMSPYWGIEIRGLYQVGSSGARSQYDYPFALRLKPEASRITTEDGSNQTPAVELERLEYEGFPGLSEKVFRLRWENRTQSWEIRGNSNLTLKR